MPTNNYKINRSNYTIRTKHQRLNNGYIYERDYMTTSSPGSWAGDVFSYGENNFKMVRRIPSNGMRKHQYGEWLKGGCGDSAEEGSEYWSLNCLGDVTGTTENRIVIKPNYGNISDFAYYGSLTELLKTTVNHIVQNFPAELYVTDNYVEYWDDRYEQTKHIGDNFSDDIVEAVGVIDKLIAKTPSGPMLDDLNECREIVSGITSDGTLVRISNPFEIDITTKSLNTLKKEGVNLMRYFCESARHYYITNKNSNSSFACPCDWRVLYKTRGCYNGQLTSIILLSSTFRGNGENNVFLVFEYYYNNYSYLVTYPAYSGYSVRPLDGVDGKDNYFQKFFDGLDDFGNLLLDRGTDPLYTCTIDYPHETEKGLMTYKKSFTWPLAAGGYNLDIDSTVYNEYVNSLISLAEFYDNGYTNNLWNRMTHDSIKNMDQTFTRPNSTDGHEDYVLGTSRIEGLIQSYGRLFDDIKRAIDNIRYSNNITYNEYNNLPDYFLSDTLGLSGWEVYNSTVNLAPATANINSKVWDASMANVQFMRNLKLNSKAIFSRKGTKRGLEMVLGLFGLRSYDFARSQYDGLPPTLKYSGNTFDSIDRSTQTQMYEYRIDEYVAVASGGTSCPSGDTLSVENYNKLKYNYEYEGDSLQGLPCIMVQTPTIKYIVPWFTNVKELDGNPYFQMYGGWGKMQSKLIKDDIKIYPTEKQGIYDETLKYMGVVKTVANLLDVPIGRLHDGDVYYVYDLSDFEGQYGSAYTENVSHFFYLGNREHCDVFGVDTVTGENGWINVSNSEIESRSGDAAMRVLYLDSLIDDVKGNNQHIGYGKYDDGDEYLDYFRHLFKYSVDNSKFSDDAYTCSDGDLPSGITDVGFNIELQKDNVKCWYFTDDYHNDGINIISDGVAVSDTIPNVGRNNSDTFYKSELNTYDFENSGTRGGNLESASYSVINIKKVKIFFEGDYTKGDVFKKYFYASINPYLKQVMPSTTIYELSFLSDNTEETKLKLASAVGITDSSELNTYEHNL